MSRIETHTQKSNKFNAAVMRALTTLKKGVAKLVDNIENPPVAPLDTVEAAIATMKEASGQLDAILVPGGTEEERRAVLDKINSAITGLETIVPEVKG